MQWLFAVFQVSQGEYRWPVEHMGGDEATDLLTGAAVASAYDDTCTALAPSPATTFLPSPAVVETVQVDQLDGRVAVRDAAQVVGEAGAAEAEQAGLLGGSGAAVAGGRQVPDAPEAFQVGEAHRVVPLGLADGEECFAAGRLVFGLAEDGDIDLVAGPG
jgi:hypothetical protein